MSLMRRNRHICLGIMNDIISIMKKKQLLRFGLIIAVLCAASHSIYAQITDSIDRHGNRIKTFGQDSVYRYTNDHKLFAIDYLDTSSIVKSITFKDDDIYIMYNPQNNPDGLSEEHFENGVIVRRWYAKDSIIVSMGYAVHCHAAYINYYPNGNIESTGQQGFVGSQETSVGLHKKYRKSGKLLLSEDFIYPQKALEDNTDSEFLTYVIVREYHLNEKLHSRKIYSNYVWYDTDHPDDDDSGDRKRRLGLWAYYNDRDGSIFLMNRYSNLNEKTGENTPFDEIDSDNWEEPGILEIFNLSTSVDARDKARRTALMVAIEVGDDEMVHTLIERNANVNAYDHHSHNVLHYASRSGQLKTVELLLAKGAEFSPSLYPRRNAIFPAIERGYVDIVKCLVEAGCGLNVYTNYDATPLITAVTNGHYEIAKYLLEQGAKANYSHYEKSPLNIAASAGNIQLIELFLDRIEEDAKWNELISTALFHASNKGQIDAVKRLLATNVKLREQDYLQEAVVFGQAQSVEFWIDRGADANAFYRNSWWMFPKYTLVEEAARYGYTDVVKVLVARGAAISSEIMVLATVFGDSEMIHFLLANGMKTTPYLLPLAASNLQTENVRTLLSLGLKANSRTHLKRTAMMEAALYYYDEMSGELSFPEIEKRVYEISKLLIENGANVNAKDYEGMTALMFAVKGGYTETVKLLLSKGARLDGTNKFGDKVADFYTSYVNPYGTDTILLDILKIEYTPEDVERGYLSDRPTTKWVNQHEKNDVLRQAIYTDNPKEVKRALNAGSATGFYNHYAEETPMGEALERGNSIAVLRLLIQYGAPVDVTNRNGTTPLMRAVMGGDYSAVKYFIKRGASINQKNFYNNAALIFAAKNGDLRMIKLLVKNGADVNTEGNYCTPLSKAREYNHDKAAELLLELGATEKVKLLE